MSHIPYYEEDILEQIGPASDDVMDQSDTVSLSEIEETEQDQLSTAGVDDLTAVDTFLTMQGDTTFVTDL